MFNHQPKSESLKKQINRMAILTDMVMMTTAMMMMKTSSPVVRQVPLLATLDGNDNCDTHDDDDDNGQR